MRESARAAAAGRRLRDGCQNPAVEERVGLADLARSLGRRPGAVETDVPAHRKAAVAAILRERSDESELLFIRRAEHPRDPWSGQMGLPGGRVEPADATPLEAALRETREEIGLDLAAFGRLLGRLSEVRTHLPPGSVPYSVVPFAFSVDGDPALTPNEEVQEVLWVPLSFLADDANRSAFTWVRRGLPLPMRCFRFEGRVIWGLTLRIVDDLLSLSKR